MPNYTSNYKLTKPLPNELYNIDIQNNNMDIIDTNLKKASDTASESNTRSKKNEIDLEALKSFQEDPFSETGSLVQVDLFQDAPLNVVSVLEPRQSGSGDPSPDNIRPITGYDTLNLAAAGANLAPTHSNFAGSLGLTYSVSDGKLTITGTATKNVRLDTQNLILPPGQYTLAPNNSVPAPVALYMRKSDGTQFGSINLASSTTAKHTFTLTETTEACVSLYISSGAELDVTVAIMLNAGAKKEFELYQGNIYTVPIGQTVYGGRIDWNTGVLEVDRVTIAFDGSETWQLNTQDATEDMLFFLRLHDNLPASSAHTICSHAPSAQSSPINDLGCFVSAKYSVIYLNLGETHTIDTFKAYLATQHATGNPMQVCYKLATPTTIQLTPHEISALPGVNTLYGDGVLTVSGRKDIIWLTHSLIKRIEALEAQVAGL